MQKKSMVPNDLLAAQELAYEPCGFIVKNIVQELESQSYGACDFEINIRRIKFRVAKITPTKIGQFVTLWKREKENGPIIPFDTLDPIDLFVINASSMVN